MGVEKMIWKTVLPRFYFAKSKYLSPIVGTLINIPVNKAGLGLLNPLTSANEKYLSFFQILHCIQFLPYEGHFLLMEVQP